MATELEKIYEYEGILLKNPRSPLFAMLAECYRKMGRLEKALGVTTKGLKYKPDFVSGLVVHSRILFDLEKYEQAIEKFEKSLTLSPKNLLALRFMALCHSKLGQNKKAMGYVKRLLALNPGDREGLELSRQLGQSPDPSSSPKKHRENLESVRQSENSPGVQEKIVPENQGFGGEKQQDGFFRLSFMEQKNKKDPRLVEIQKRKKFYLDCLQRLGVDPLKEN